MPGFDLQGARAAGYSDADIAGRLAETAHFDLNGARAAGYTDSDIAQHLSEHPHKPITGKETPAYEPSLVDRVFGRNDPTGNQNVTGIVPSLGATLHDIRTEQPSLGDVALAGAKGLGQGSNELMRDVNLVGGAVPVTADAIHSLITGRQETGLQDKFFANTVAPLEANRSAFETPADASVLERTAHGIGGAAEFLSEVGLTGPEEIAAKSATPLGEFIAKTIEHATKTMAVPSTKSAVTTGGDVYNATQDPSQALGAAAASYAGTTAIGTLPLSTPGNLVQRVIQGAVSGAVMSEADRELVNLTLPPELQRQFSTGELGQGALETALLAAVMGPGAAAERRGGAHETPVDEWARRFVEAGGEIKQPEPPQAPAALPAPEAPRPPPGPALLEPPAIEVTPGGEAGTRSALDAAAARTLQVSPEGVAATPSEHQARAEEVTRKATELGLGDDIVANLKRLEERKVAALEKRAQDRKALPAPDPTMYVDQGGNASTPAQLDDYTRAANDAMARARAEQQQLGYTPDVAAAGLQREHDERQRLQAEAAQPKPGETPELMPLGDLATAPVPLGDAIAPPPATPVPQETRPRGREGYAPIERQPDAPVYMGKKAEAERAKDRAKIEAAQQRAELRKQTKVPDERVDDVLAYVAKRGGIDSAEAIAQGLDPATVRSAKGYGIRRPFKKGGMSFDTAAEMLHEAGYPVTDEQGRYSANKVLDVLDRATRGEKIHSVRNETAMHQAELERQAADERQIESKALTDRRANIPERKRVAAMSHEELQRELLTSHLTGLPNKRAYEEATRLPHQASVDVDSLKWVNDNMGHESGDHVLKAVGQALADVSTRAYHFSGDEFVLEGADEAEIRTLLDDVNERLKDASVEITKPDGTKVTYKGLGISYGTGTSLHEADQRLSTAKTEREAQGLRAARGDRPAGVTSEAAQGVQDHGRDAATTEEGPDQGVVREGPPTLEGERRKAERGDDVENVTLKGEGHLSHTTRTKSITLPSKLEGEEPPSAREQLALFGRTDARPGSTDAQIELANKLLEELDRYAGRDGEIKSLAVAFNAEMRQNHAATLVGQSIQHPRDLAFLAQVFRNPRYETIRYFALNDAKKVVGQTGVSSRLPAAGAAFPHGHDWPWLEAFVKRTGAKHFRMVHNHPSGDPSPSEADVRLTMSIAHKLGIAIEHVVIDSNKYSVIYANPDGTHDIQANIELRAEDRDKPDKLLTPSKPHPILGRKIKSELELANTVKAMELKKGYGVVVGISARSHVRSLGETPLELVADRARLRAELQRFGIQNGNAAQFLAGVPDAWIHGHKPEGQAFRDNIQWAIEKGILLDAVSLDGTSARSVMPIGHMRNGDLGVSVRAMAREVGTDVPADGGYSDLFGQDTRAKQKLADTQREKDSKRSPNKTVDADTGAPGDLFTKRQQMDIDDQIREGESTNDEISKALDGADDSELAALKKQIDGNERELTRLAKDFDGSDAQHKQLERAIDDLGALREKHDELVAEKAPAKAKDAVQKFADEVKARHGLAEFDLRSLPNGDIRLETMAVARAGRGAGSKAMQDLVDYADEHGKRLVLELAEKGFQPKKGGPKTSSMDRLRQFYSRFGFVRNRGRAKDFTIRDSMYREPKGGDVVREEAFHGSAHTGISEFRLDKIGSGEGAHAYGHGLYFAQSPTVGNYYRRTVAGDEPIKSLRLAGRTMNERNNWEYSPKLDDDYDNVRSTLIESVLVDETDYRAVHAARGDAGVTAHVVANLKKMIRDYEREWPEGVAPAKRLLKDIEKPGGVKLELGDQPGALYTVDINDKAIATFLDWDKPMSEQPAVVQKFAKDRGITRRTGQDLYHALLEPTASEAEHWKKASDDLLAAGVRGVRYLDDLSRDPDARRKSSNFVVFDPADVTVKAINGKPVSAKERADAEGELGQELEHQGDDVAREGERGKYTHRVVSDKHGESSQHTSEELAKKAAARLQAMSNGKLPEGTFRVEPIEDVARESGKDVERMLQERPDRGALEKQIAKLERELDSTQDHEMRVTKARELTLLRRELEDDGAGVRESSSGYTAGGDRRETQRRDTKRLPPGRRSDDVPPETKKGYVATAQRAIDSWNDKVGWLWSPLGKLPGKRAYLVERYKALGNVGKSQEIGRAIYDSLSKATPADSKAVYDYMVTAAGDSSKIEDADVRRAAIRAKNLIDKVGQQLVDVGLLSKDAYDAHRGEYLPRVYLKHLLGDTGFMGLGNGKRMSDLGYLKQRKDIPEETRKVILGEITDPAFLASYSATRTMRDLALVDFLHTIAGRQQWTPKGATVEYNGRHVSPFWLADEARQLRKRAKVYNDSTTRAKALELADQMDADVDKALEQLGSPNTSEFEQVPNSARYGALRGLWVRKEIYNDLVGVQGFVPRNASVAETLLGPGGALAKATGLWKMSKVVLNPPTQIRNFLSNLVLLHLSGVPMHRVYSGELVGRAINSLVKKDKYFRVFEKYGGFASTWANQEGINVRDEWIRAQKLEGGFIPKARAFMAGLSNKASRVYQWSEAIGKVAKIIDAMEREGKTEEQAMLEAQDTLFDYSLVPRGVQYLRNQPLGAPFITFMYKALGSMLETAAKHPARFLPYLAIPYLLRELIKDMYDVTSEDLDALRKAFPAWMRERGHMLLLPYKDAEGRWQVADFGYLAPWGQFADLAAAAREGKGAKELANLVVLSGPVADVTAALETNVDPFTGRPIVRDTDPPAMQLQQMMGYVWDLAAPGIFTSSGGINHLRKALRGDETSAGNPGETPTQAAMRLFGLNVYPVDPEETKLANLRSMRFDLNEKRQRMRQLLKNPNLSAAERTAIGNVWTKEIDKDADAIEAYDQATKINPKLAVPPVTFKDGKPTASRSSKSFTFGTPAGLKTAGNIDPWNRKELNNPDGSVSTTSSISIGTDEGEVLIPTVIAGKRLSNAAAAKHYRETGEHLGIFDTPEHADDYAEKLHNEQARRMGLQ